MIRWGIWGAGKVAHDVSSDLRLVPGARLECIGSRTEASARALASTRGVSNVCTDLHAMLANPSIDVVYLATPHHVHAKDAIACLEAGKAVLCEKPLATSELEAGQIAAAARSARRFCMEAMWTRFIPAVRYALEQVKEGAVGDVVAVRGDFSMPVEFNPDSRFFSREASGGALLDRGVYLASLTQALLGEPDEVEARSQWAPTGVDSHTSTILAYPRGVTATLTCSLVTRGQNTFSIEGDRGSIVLASPFLRADRLEVDFSKPFPSAARETPRASLSRVTEYLKNSGLRRCWGGLRAAGRYFAAPHFGFGGYGYQFQLNEVMSCMTSGRLESPYMTLSDSVAVARILDRIRAKAGSPSIQA